MSDKQIDEISGVATTGHEWDGIKELDNPMPRWWVWTFYLTIVWALAYTVAYPAWPMIRTATTGLLGFSSRADLSGTIAAARADRAELTAAIATKSLAEIRADDNLRSFAAAAGAAAFRVNCVQCHGSGAQGSVGYPNLNDDNWLWGGSLDDIHQTIAHGIRYTSDSDTRTSEMPAFGEILEPAQVMQVAHFVASLSGAEGDADDIKAGRELFTQQCVACHSEDGKGSRELGAPNLTDAIWLYGSSVNDIAAQIRAPRHGVMPAWSARLGDTTIKQLTIYVHSLGGGE
jgi:cytochrome c oxidase cbb3-type subunit 3